MGRLVYVSRATPRNVNETRHNSVYGEPDMTRVLLTIGLALNLGLFLALPAPAQPPGPPSPAPAKRQEEELVEKVRKSIEGGKTYLKNIQSPQGNWEGVLLNVVAEMDGGVTGLATLALLVGGEKATEPHVAKALAYLERLEPKKTYVVGLQNMIFAETREKKYLPTIQKNADWLIDHAIGMKAGQLEGWSYPGNSIADNSNTQYALLGLYAAKQAGAKIDDAHWRAIQEFYKRTQYKETNTTTTWRYHNTNFDNTSSFTMTVAGVCGLIIAGMGLDQSAQGLDEKSGVAANCGSYPENAPVAKGLNWIGANFAFNQGRSNSNYYNIYGIERLGRLSGQRFIGSHDWYREGCDYLVREQDADGSIPRANDGIDGKKIISTSFGVLFLSKGRTPVLVSKLAWGDHRGGINGTFEEQPLGPNGEVNWNRKHNDARHLSEYASQALFKNVPLSWQVYDARRQEITPEKILTEVGVLLQSPVLYMNGHGRIPFVGLPGERLSAQEDILKKYVDEGGFLLAEACCGDKEFTASFRTLMKRLFDGDLRPLPETHAIWTAHTVDPGFKEFAGLEGLEKGCRTVVVFSPFPLAGYWEEHRFMPEKDKPARRPGEPGYRGELAYKLAGNIIAYATGLELPKPKLSFTKVVDPNAADKAAGRSYFQAVQLKIEAEPAPAAMRNLMVHLRDTARMEVMLKKESLYPSDDNIFRYKFMYYHGRKPVKLADEDIENLRSNCQTGGVLFADAGCNGFEAWKEFDKSFRDACKKLFPNAELQPIPANDPLFSAKLNGGSAVTTVRCRREKADGTGPEAELRSVAPYLEGIKIDGRWVVIYSKYDIGCALEGHKASDCMGHDKESALRLASAVVLYSLKR